MIVKNAPIAIGSSAESHLQGSRLQTTIDGQPKSRLGGMMDTQQDVHRLRIGRGNVVAQENSKGWCDASKKCSWERSGLDRISNRMANRLLKRVL